MSYSYHKFKAGGHEYVVNTRYTLIKPIGHGAYGVVISAADKLGGANSKVAIKKVTSAFMDVVDAKRILREIKLLKCFNHENIIGILDVIPPPPSAISFDDIYIVQHLMETDLHRIIYSRQPLSIDHCQYFLYQILKGLKYIHSASVIHRDLKPSNILLNSNCDLKICDFGLARPVGDANKQAGAGASPLTEYVQTRWYRAPEIMLACTDYTKAVDVWSVGCIFAELLNRNPLFPGEDYIAQLRLICDKLGNLSEKDLDFVVSERARRFMLGLPAKAPTPMSEIFPNNRNDTAALDLLKKMLEFHPSRRITVDECLAHPFMSQLHNSDEEPVLHSNFSFAFDSEPEMTNDRVRELIWEEIKSFHPSIPAKNPTARNNGNI